MARNHIHPQSYNEEQEEIAAETEYEQHKEETLGQCGCVDYHMADCPLITSRLQEEDEYDIYAGRPDPEDW